MQRNFMLCIPHQIFVRWSNQERDGRSIRYVGRTEEVHTGFWWRDLRKTAHLEDLDIDENKILKLIIRNWIGRHGGDCPGSA
jgi:hypothetical protein